MDRPDPVVGLLEPDVLIDHRIGEVEEQGPVMPGSGGLRKLRWGRTGHGRRGGLRVIYYWASTEEAFYMLYVYAKNEQGDLTMAQVKILATLVREEFQ